MDLTAWALYALVGAAIIAAALLHYHRREPTVRGRSILGMLRGVALALIVLLLFDPVLPVGAGTEGPTVALVDASLSMKLPTADGTRWDRAGAALQGLDADRIQLFGSGDTRSVGDLEGVEPYATATRLAPALRGALESGAARVIVVTDGAVEDAADVARVAGEGVARIEPVMVGAGTLPNLGIAEVRAPGWVEAGEEVALAVEVARIGEGGEGGEGDALPDSVTVVAMVAGRERARTRVAVPPPGRTAGGVVRFRAEAAMAAAEGEPVRVDVEVRPGGSVADDDVRSRYMRIAEEPAGVAMVSFRPDQELRFLLPVLERALGVPVRGWLALPGDRFLRLGAGSEAGVPRGLADVRREVDRAGLVVLHGLGSDGPGWALEALAEADRLLVFPGDPVPEPVPGEPGPLRPGDWYPAGDLPSSPIAGLLAGLEAGQAPPLAALRSGPAPGGFWTPLQAREDRAGEAYPVLVARRDGSRRIAVALGTGYWRWAFAGSAGREVYDRMWSAVAGWLMEDDAGGGRDAVRPESPVVARGEPVRWVVGGGADSLDVTLTGAGAPRDTTVAVTGGRASTATLPPGHYRFSAVAAGRAGAGGGRVATTAEGDLTVESYSPEFVRPSSRLALGDGDGPEGARRRANRPLHATPWPYALIILLLCVEWVLRRRWGLR